MRAGEFDRIQSYLAGIAELSGQFGKKFAYKQYDKPLWRGVATKRAMIEDYSAGRVGTWPLFQSTSQDRETALTFSAIAGKRVRTGEESSDYSKDHSLAVFKIYLNPNNDPVTNVDTGAPDTKLDFSYFPKEKEVLLFPFFNF